ncbi:hypothetical protein [Actinomadura xylanilytica]|nr:hypothetical protein [Actinomadura xylanilytica]MDL4772492.1 hypothetical protein [Actinomadura xylanilytica]
MFPQKSSKVGQWVAGVVVAVYAVNNPTSAAHMINKIVAAIQQFAGALG